MSDIEDARMCVYFYEGYGDVTRYADWPEVRGRLLVERPEVVAAVDALRVAERTLTAVLKNWEDEAEDDEE